MTAEQAARESQPNPVLDAALGYALLGWRVFPLVPRTKKPATPKGFYDAVTDPAAIQKLFARPELNLGIRTGAESGIVVIDIDPRHNGHKSLAVWESMYGPLPKTVRATTGGGGSHLVFRHPGGRVRNRTGVRPGIDVRGDGGYIAASPSVHPDGPGYAWDPGHGPGECEIADAPDWLLDLILRCAPAEDDAPASKPRTQEPRGPGSEDELLLRRARKYVESVTPSQEGSRNTDAFRLAGHLRQFCDEQAHYLDDGVIFELLREWNARCSPPLPEHELLICLRNAGKNGTPPPPKPPKGGPGTTSGGFGGARPGDTDKEWPDPQPLTDALPPVQPFRDDLLPDAVRPWVFDIADRMQCAVDFISAALLVVLASLIGRRVAIRPKRHDDWGVVPNLWGGAIGPPSVLKTPAVQEVMRPLQRLEVDARKRFEEEFQKHLAECALADAKKANAKKGLKEAIDAGEPTDALAREASASGPRKPVRTRRIVNDASVEKLGEILNENPFGVLQFRDEMIGFLRSLDKEGQEPARAFYLEAWNGMNPFTYDRIGRGTIDIESTTVSMFGCIPPGPLAHYLRGAITGGKDDDGFIQRIQVAVWPDTTKAWKNVDRWPDNEARTRAYAVLQRLSELSSEDIGAKPDKFDQDGIPFLRFDDKAQIIFDAWRERLELRLRDPDEHTAFVSHLGKYRSLFPSIALIFHIADGCTGPVKAEYARMAEAWCDYLESHARRIYALVVRADYGAARALSLKILNGSVKSPFTLKEVYKNDWAGLSSREMVRAAVDILADHDWLAEKVEKGPVGAPKTTFVVNPKIYARETPPGGTSETSASDGDWGAI